MAPNPSDLATDGRGRADERLQFLAGSGVRTAILRALDDRSLNERDLRDRLGAPRSTVHQNVGKLVDRDWIEETGDGYRTTWIGSIMLEEYESYARNVETAERLEPLLSYVDESAVNLAVLHDVEVTTSRPNQPNAAIKRVAELLAGANSVRTFTPYLVPRFVDLLGEKVAAGDLDVEALLTATAGDALRREHAEAVAAAVDHEAVTYYRYEGTLPFALSLVDDTVVLGAFDDRGHPRTVAETESSAARTWATSVYERYRNRARRVGGDAGNAARNRPAFGQFR